jgi:hypothetical protein
VFISTDDTEKDAEGFFIDHGDRWGELSMFRNVLQLEGEWRPGDNISLHGIFRGVRSSMLDADDEAQVPDPGAIDDPAEWVHRRYYTEAEMRELYLDFQAADFVSIRAGRQQVSWGETGQYRLLDAINPVDSSWHFSSLESFEDMRIPLWILKMLFDVNALNGGLEIVWIPALDDPEDMVTVPLTLVGAWGLPKPNRPKKASTLVVDRKIFLWPENDVENSRIGVRWKGNLGDFTYTMLYYYTHILSPPIPTFLIVPEESPDYKLHADVYLEFPRQHLAGFSMEYTFASPIWTVARVEATIEPDRVYPSSTDRRDPKLDPSYDGEGTRYLIATYEKTVVNYAVVLMRPTFIRFLNPKESFLVVAQFMHTYIADFEEDDNDLYPFVDIPAYDSTEVTRHAMKAILALRTNYMHGMLVPSFTGAYLFGGNSVSDAFKFETPSGFASVKCDIVIGNHWRVTPAANFFFGKDPYRGAGLFRDRDELNLMVKYQF